MQKMYTGELGVSDDSVYCFTPPDRKTANTLFYSGCTCHYYVSDQYQFSHNILPTIHWPGGITHLPGGKYYSERYGFAFDLRYIAIAPVSGRMLLITDDIYTFSTGQVALFDIYNAHSYCALEKAEIYMLMFDGLSSNAIVSDLTANGNIFNLPLEGNCYGIFRELQQSAENGNTLSPLVQSSMIHNLLAQCDKSRLIDNPTTQQSKISDSVNYINHHYKEDLKLEFLANQVFLSSNYFLVLFKEEMGVTPYEYLLQIRFTIAKSLLITTKKSVKEIAFEVGFNSDVHFMNMFKKRFGISPSAFRRSVATKLFE